MCVIIVKPRGVKLPSRELLRKAYRANDDGFGLAYHPKNAKQVTIIKGAMSFRQTYKIITSVPNPKSCNMILHFRLATEGKICPENCHPYPLSNRVKKLRATQIDCSVAIAHNGMIITEEKEYSIKLHKSKPLEKNLTDTQEFIKSTLSTMGLAVLNKTVGMLIQEYAGGKFALLSPSKLLLLGSFTKDSTNGLYYSNTTFKETAVFDASTYGAYSYSNMENPYAWASPISSGLSYAKCEICNEWRQTKKIDDVLVCAECAEELGVPQISYTDSTRYSTYGDFQQHSCTQSETEETSYG